MESPEMFDILHKAGMIFHKRELLREVADTLRIHYGNFSNLQKVPTEVSCKLNEVDDFLVGIFREELRKVIDLP